MGRIKTHRELEVYQMAFEAAMEIFEVTKGFVKCGYLTPEVGRELYTTYDHIIGKIVNMILHPEKWIIGK